MQVMHVDRVLDGTVSKIIGRSVRESWTHAATGHPHGERLGMVVAPVAVFDHRCSAELGAPQHQCVIQQPALREIGQQACDRTIDLWQTP